MRTGCRVAGRRVADGGGQHQYVSGSVRSADLDAQSLCPVRFTYEIAPIFILMEHVVLKKMREIIGFQNGDSILAPGRIPCPVSFP